MRYSDGDQEDLDEKEFNAALELHFNLPTTTNDNGETNDEDSLGASADERMSSGSDDEESYVPSPEVKSFSICQFETLTLLTVFSPSRLEEACSQKS